MGSFLDKPKTEKTNDHGHGNDLRYGLAAMQGWRVEMEDAHTSIASLPLAGLENWSFFAVFDGHAGGTVSKHGSKELLQSIYDADIPLFQELAQIYSATSTTTTSTNIINTNTEINIENNNENNKNSTLNSIETTTTSSTKNETDNNLVNNSNNSSSTNLKINNLINKEGSNNLISLPPVPAGYTDSVEKRLEKAIRAGFLNLDAKLRKMPELSRGEDKSGSTAVACLISPTHIYLINCGDSRAIVSTESQVSLQTLDHKPINATERERIQNAGGSVMIQRVNGSLAVSRALGDYEYKSVEGRGACEQLVSPEPEIYIKKRSAVDEFVCLACDGIWDVMSNENLRDYLSSRLKIHEDLVKISNDVLDMCLNKGSRDNMSVIIVTFPGAPKVTQDEIDKDQTCNEKIETRIKEMIKDSSTKVEFSQVISKISEEKWNEFPPGGGVQAKQSVIEETFNRLVVKSNEDETINPGSFVLNSPL